MIVAAYVATGYVIVMVCFFTAWCHPFHAYYDVIPLPDDQCTKQLSSAAKQIADLRILPNSTMHDLPETYDPRRVL